MTDDYDQAVREARDQSWDEGYFSLREGLPPAPPQSTPWPSQWLLGRMAAEESARDKEDSA